MALVSKKNRCAVCGSTEVTYSEGAKLYHCAACGQDCDHLMPESDLAAIDRIIVLGDSEGKLDELRRRYPRLDVASWNKEDRLQF